MVSNRGCGWALHMILHGRKVVGGDVTGPVAKSTSPLSFLGEIDPRTGMVENPSSELNGRSVAGTVLTFPEARGSTVGPYVLYGAKKRGVAPVAMVVHNADAIVASAAVLARIPCVDSIPLDLLEDGDQVHVRGDAGIVEVPSVQEVHVVTSILRNREGKVLLLRRSDRVGSFRGRWAGVSGFVEASSPEEQAYQEIQEETGIARETLVPVSQGDLVRSRDGGRVFVVHPFLFDCGSPEVRLDWEHTECRWIAPRDLSQFATVPKLDQVFRSLGIDTTPAKAPGGSP